MATRHNLCLNPALLNNTTGWGGGATPTRTAVTGFVRPWAARYTSGTFLSSAPTATGAVTVGLTYTVSIYLRPTTNGGGNIYIEWLNSGGGGFGYPSASYSLTASTVGRASVTAVAPTGAVGCRIVVDGINMGVNAVDATAVLLEQVAALDTYFDGDTSGATWDGTAGNSASTLTDSVTVTAAGAAGVVRVRTSAGLLTAVRAVIQAGPGSAVRVRAGSGRVQAAGAAPQAAAAGAVRIRASAGTSIAVRHAPLAGAAAAVRARAGSGAVTAAQVATVAGRPGALRIRAGAGSVTAVQHAPLAGASARVAVRAGSGTVSTVAGGVSVTLTGPAVSVRIRAAAPAVTAAQQQILTGTTTTIRLRPSGGQLAAAQQVTLTGGPVLARLRAFAGAVVAVDLGDGVLLTGRPAVARTRAVPGLVVAARNPILVGAAAAVRVLATAGTVTASDTPEVEVPPIGVGPPRLLWTAGPPSTRWPASPPRIGRS